jgi:predicted transcriptional regulator
MNLISDKDLVIKAIEDYDLYSKSDKKLLGAFIDLQVANSVMVRINSLSKLMGVTRAMIYNSIKKLMDDGIISRVNTKYSRVSNYSINYSRLEQLVELYNKKQEYLAKR